MKTLLLVLFVSAASLLTIPSLAAEPGYDVPEPGSYQLPVIKTAADGPLINSTGRAVRLRELVRGRITVMSFIYTRCQDATACPYATGVLMDLHQTSAREQDLARQLRLVSLSFDPERDTPRRMAEYAAAAGRPEGAPWHFVTAASARDLAPVLSAYGQAVDERKNPSDPAGPLHHLLRVFLIDGDGMIRNIYSSGTLDARLILADVRTLMREAVVLTPEKAAREAGLARTLSFKVETAACVTDLTRPEDKRPVEVLLTDAVNGEDPHTPTERAGVLVRIPASAIHRFQAKGMDDLAGRFEGRRIRVTGLVATEPHPLRSNGNGGRQLRPVLTVTSPHQIKIVDQP